jgi:DNA-binding MarR family transcriptional regulator
MHHHFASVALSLDLTPPQMGMLKELGEGTPMGALASMIRCDASNVTWMTDRLEERGLVERVADPKDRRVKRLVLTEAGRRLRKQIDRRLRAALPVHHLNESEQRILARLLEKMIDSIPEPDVSRI